MSRVAVIGGGPAGMIAAAEAAKAGHAVFLYEKNEKLGKKLFITGKGRCNLTNNADMDEFLNNIPRNPKFLYSALYGFTNTDVVALINNEGVPTKVERGGRVFPESDHSSDVIKALAAYLKKSGAVVLLNRTVTEIRHDLECFTVITKEDSHTYDALILSTGGASYPTTGSTGDGYAFAKNFGHTITQIRPSLIPLATEETWPKELMGLSLRNVTLSAFKRGKLVFEELGEMLFTHFGVSGPLILSASSHMADEPKGAKLKIDLKPGLNEEALDKRVLRDFDKNSKKQFQNALGELLPAKLVPVAVTLSGIAPHTLVSEITRVQRLNFVKLLKGLTLHVKEALPVEYAIVTRGGVSVKEVNASTLESKLVKNLYFAGELLDVDAYTGGFNLQIAYSTGALAGRNIR
jgi:predicted Rossmann fold flavoprotein